MKWKLKRPGLPNLSVCVLAIGAIAASIAIPAAASDDGRSAPKHAAVEVTSASGGGHPVCTKKKNGSKLCADVVTGVAPTKGCHRSHQGDKLCDIAVACGTLPGKASAVPLQPANAPATRLKAVPLPPKATKPKLKAVLVPGAKARAIPLPPGGSRVTQTLPPMPKR